MTMTETRPSTRLTVRKPVIDFSDSPKYWVIDDPQSTHALNLLHFGIPAGERYFIDSVKLAMPYVTDQQLLSDARSFIGQEAVHARIHERAADHLGLFENRVIRARVENMDRTRERLYQRIDAMPEPFRKQAVLAWLSTTLLGEHFTALLADMVFDEEKVDESQIDPAMASLLKWHAAEELEHRTLPYDLYQHVGGSYVVRAAPALPAFVLLPIGLIAITSFGMLADPEVRRPFSVRSYLRAAKSRRLPWIGDVLGKLAPYLRVDFHPLHLGEDARAEAWLDEHQPSLEPPKRKKRPAAKSTKRSTTTAGGAA